MDTKKILIVIAIVLGIVVIVAAFSLMSDPADFEIDNGEEFIDDEPFDFEDDEDFEDEENDVEEEEEEEEELDVEELEVEMEL